MPAGQGKDAERLAAAIEQGTPPGSPVESELARDLEIVAMLRSRGAAYSPQPDARAAAKQRLMAALAQQNGGSGRVAPAAGPTERTAPIRPVSSVPVIGADATSVTAEMQRITDTPGTDTVDAGAASAHVDARDVTAPDVAGARPRRAGRHSLPSRPAARAGGSRRPARTGLRRRAVLVGSAALLAMIAIAGGSFASRDALPGDALYAMKRISENTGLALTFDDQARAQRQLELAGTRLDEVEQLVQSGDAADVDPAAVESAIRDFDTSTAEGSRGVLSAQDASGPAALADLRAWAAEQAARFSVLRSALPAPAVGQADTSIEFLDRLLGRTEALEARSSCSEITSSRLDELGFLPSEDACTPRLPDTGATGDPSDAATTDPGATDESDEPTSSSDPTTTGSTTPESTPTEDGRLLPELGPDGLPLPGVPTGANTSGSDDGQISVPLPLVPPIQLPPLLPGLPGVSIG